MNIPLLLSIAALMLVSVWCGWYLRGPRIRVVRIIYARRGLYAQVHEQLRTIARLKRLHTHDVETIVALQEQLAARGKQLSN